MKRQLSALLLLKHSLPAVERSESMSFMVSYSAWYEHFSYLRLTSCAIKLCTKSRARVLELTFGFTTAGADCIRNVGDGGGPSQSNKPKLLIPGVDRFTLDNGSAAEIFVIIYSRKRLVLAAQVTFRVINRRNERRIWSRLQVFSDVFVVNSSWDVVLRCFYQSCWFAIA